MIVDATDDPDLPADLRAFIYSCIDTVEAADTLVRLRQLERPATVRELSGELGLSPAVTRRCVEVLTARGLLAAEVGSETVYRYAPESVRLRDYVELLAEAYASRRDAVIRAVSMKAARAFADAFKFRK